MESELFRDRVNELLRMSKQQVSLKRKLDLAVARSDESGVKKANFDLLATKLGTERLMWRRFGIY